MSPVRIDLEQFRDFILAEYHANTSQEKICDKLLEIHGLVVRPRTLRQRLQQWNIKPIQPKTKTSDTLEARLKELYYEHGLRDRQLHKRLVDEGYTVSLTGVKTLRKSANIYRRLDPIRLGLRKQELRDFFEKEQFQENITSRLGLRMLYTHMRQRHFNISHRPLYAIYQEYHSAEVEHRRNKQQRRRGGWRTPGPNYIWSVDAYCKLEAYGFEVYAGIDAYARYITWFYCGVSARTARSLFAQYVNVVGTWGYIPHVIRADRGNELAIMSGAHFYLSQGTEASRASRHMAARQHAQVQATADENEPLASHTFADNHYVSVSDPDMAEPVCLRDCFSFGKSTANQRIESWWSRLCEGRSLFWRVSYS